jgi:hypothetical protein
MMLSLVLMMPLLTPTAWSCEPEQVPPAAEEAVQEMEVRIRSSSGRLQLFVGAELGQPASRSIGRSPERLTIACRAESANKLCVGTTNKDDEFWSGDCLILALDSEDQEMVLSGEHICRALDPEGDWKLELDFTRGVVVASERKGGSAGPRSSSAAGAASSTRAKRNTDGVSLIPERFNRRVSNSKQRKLGVVTPP